MSLFFDVSKWISCSRADLAKPCFGDSQMLDFHVCTYRENMVFYDSFIFFDITIVDASPLWLRAL